MLLRQANCDFCHACCAPGEVNCSFFKSELRLSHEASHFPAKRITSLYPASVPTGNRKNWDLWGRPSEFGLRFGLSGKWLYAHGTFRNQW